MERYRQRISLLFGEDGFTDDEKTIQEQQTLKQRIKDALGSDSETEEPTEHWSDTSISTDEEEDTVDLTCNDLEADLKDLQIGKVQTEHITFDERRHAKELAQFQRQMAARINKRKYNDDIGQYGVEVFQKAENLLQRTSLIEATITSLSAVSESINDLPTPAQHDGINDTKPRLTRAERRTADKRAWYKRKK
ncbi:unnamed protein product [Macrosiphum euphorbiae]|uniref:Uncharacterized protein n=1 Tax=Macrosiphum euphorbiae TaxID=13131 RepID=A0AAV0XWS4_9HEMI|nr:unnamed protein product [Macrosiphum euphorbiae]